MKSKKVDRDNSFKALTARIYSSQKAASKRRGHPQPAYTLAELRAWIVQQPNFADIFEKWAASGHKQQLIPSADRLKDSMPYSLDNIRLVTLRENIIKAGQDSSAAICRPNRKYTPIAATSSSGELLAKFPSCMVATRSLGIPNSFFCEKIKNGAVFKDGFYWINIDEHKTRRAQFEEYPWMPKRICCIRASEQEISQISELAETMGVNLTEVILLAVDRLAAQMEAKQ